MFKGCNCEVKVDEYKGLESAIYEFNKKVKDLGILRDWKINVGMSREERKAFKEFVRNRRRKKKQQRILKALERLDNYKIIEKPVREKQNEKRDV